MVSPKTPLLCNHHALHSRLKSLNIGMGTTVEKVLASLSDIQPVPNLLSFVATFDTVSDILQLIVA